MPKPYKRKLIPVLDKRFQYKYTAIIIAIAAVVSAVLGYLLLDSYRELNRILDLARLMPEISDEVHADQALGVFYLSAGFLVLEVVLLGLTGLILTHRMCGPVFVIQRQLTTLLEGKYPMSRPLRHGDEFGATLEVLTRLVAALKTRDVNEAEALTRAIAAARQSGAADAVVAPLQRLVDERQQRVNG